MPALTDRATVSFVRENNLAERVVAATDLAASTVTRKLNGANGNALLRNLFRDQWPTRFTVARVRTEHLYARVAVATGMRTADVRDTIQNASGNCHVCTALSLEDHEGEDEQQDHGGLGNDTGAPRRHTLAYVEMHLVELVDAVEQRGERIVILRKGKPVATLVPVEEIADELRAIFRTSR